MTSDNTATKSTQEAVPISRLGAIFGRSTTWGYRLKYKGLVKVIVCMGLEYVPREEINRLLNGGDGTLPVRGRPRKSKCR